MTELKVVSGGRCLSEANCPAVMLGDDGLVYIIAKVKENADGTVEYTIPGDIVHEAIEANVLHLMKEKEDGGPTE